MRRSKIVCTLGPAVDSHEMLVSPADARVKVAVVPTDEELEIATQVYALVKK